MYELHLTIAKCLDGCSYICEEKEGVYYTKPNEKLMKSAGQRRFLENRNCEHISNTSKTDKNGTDNARNPVLPLEEFLKKVFKYSFHTV